MLTNIISDRGSERRVWFQYLCKVALGLLGELSITAYNSALTMEGEYEFGGKRSMKCAWKCILPDARFEWCG